MNIAYINNKFIPLDKAKVSVLDRGFLYGDGIFETMRFYNTSVFRLKKHTSRLFNSLKDLDICPPGPKGTIEKKVCELIKKNRLSGDAYIKIIVTRGRSEGLLVPCPGSRSLLVIYALRYKGLPKTAYTRGVKVSLSRTGFNRNHPAVKHKTLNYLPNIVQRIKAARNGFDDTILVNDDGMLTEASSSNIFLVKGEKIYTPSIRCGILPGITREEVIRLAGKFLKTKTRQVFIKKSFLCDASEIFLTNSLAEIVPVVKIAGRTVGKGVPGTITKKLIRLYRDAVRE